MLTPFEYTVVDESFGLFTDQTPPNRLWYPFSFDIRRLPTGNKIWIRRRLEESGPGYIMNISCGNGNIQKFSGCFDYGALQGLPALQQFQLLNHRERSGMYMIAILVRPVADILVPMVLSLSKNTLQQGKVRIDASTACTGTPMWSQTYDARDAVRGIELRNKIQSHLVEQGRLTLSSPAVRLIIDTVLVRGNKIVKHPTQFGKRTPARTQYPKTPYMNTIRCWLKRR